MAKRSSKFNLGYFCSVKNIVPIILVVIIVFLVFNILQNNSFNPFIEGNTNLKQAINDASGNISNLINEIGQHTNNHNNDQHNHADISGIISNFPNLDNLTEKISSLTEHANDGSIHQN
tara:strand:+ start:1696 stop:2052 length:357 start_codon:yes stop_codon:yes gene_type:complete